MPSNVRRFCIFFVIFLAALTVVSAQNVAQNTSSTLPPVAGPTSGDIMRERIVKAKAFIAVRNYNAAIYELENIRKESADEAVRSAAQVLLMNSYLEQGDFKRAQDLLTEFFNIQKTTRAGALASYMAVAGQVVKGARNRADRYKTLGLSISDRTLPLEALNDLEKMRELLETVVTQSKEIAQTQTKAGDAMALMEEATASRSVLARDDYDSRRWRDVVADTREQMASSRTVVMNAVNDGSGDISKTNTPAIANSKPTETSSTASGPAPVPVTTQPVSQPISEPVNRQPSIDAAFGGVRQREVKLETAAIPENAAPQDAKPIYVPSSVREEPKPEPKSEAKSEPKQDRVPQASQKPEPTQGPGTQAAAAPLKTDATNALPLEVGSLLGYATYQSQPVYPIAAKTMRATGVVKVEVMVDEKGEVASVKKVSGPPMLQDAAKDAIKKWKFKPFVRDGQPVKASGFVSFNFNI